mgnify:CR=1 FL=1
MTQDTAWKKTVYVLVCVHLLTASGFSFVTPFLPLYVKTLGSNLGGSVALWSGLIFSAPAITMMVMAPVWGFVADRHGRKLMLVRSTVAGAVLLTCMGFVRSAEELFVLRLLQGLFTGNIAASNALVAATIPKKHAGVSFGMLRTASWVGLGLGPLFGGVIGDTVGFRQSFFVTGGVLAVASMGVLFVLKEKFVPPSGGHRRGFFSAYRFVLRTPGLRRIYSISFLHHLAKSSITPIVPLFLIALDGGAGVATVAGILFGLRAFAGAASAPFVGRVGDRVGHGRVLLLAAVGMTLLYLPQPFVQDSWQLIVLQFLSGFLAVGIIPGIGALLSGYLPEGTSGATFGLESSIGACARSLGPLIGAGVAACLGYRWVFVWVGLVYGMVVVLSLPLFGQRRGDVGEEVLRGEQVRETTNETAGG